MKISVIFHIIQSVLLGSLMIIDIGMARLFFSLLKRPSYFYGKRGYLLMGYVVVIFTYSHHNCWKYSLILCLFLYFKLQMVTSGKFAFMYTVPRSPYTNDVNVS